MPSSISSSEVRQWWLTWLLSALLVLLCLGSYEWWLRSEGFRPSVDTNQDLWNHNRSQAGHGEQVIALLGASRIQLGLDTNTMRHALPQYQVVPLAINGQYPLATLQGLAADEDFTGVVIMSLMAQMLEPQYMDMQAEANLDYAENYSLYASFDAFVTAQVQAHLTFLHPLMGLQELVEHYSAKHQFVSPFYISYHPDTSASGDYSQVDTAALKRHFVDEKSQNYQQNPAMSHATWLQQIKILATDIRAIQARGGEVILVRFPTDGGHWVLDEQYYPRADYWDVLQQQYPDLKMIHFKDDSTLAAFALPDTSHLDQTDAQLFTQHLLAIMDDRGWIKKQ